MSLINFIRGLRRPGRSSFAERGIAAVEFAMSLPILITMLLGGFELTRYMLIVQKADRIAYSVADITAQLQSTPTTAQLADIVLAAGEIMKPFIFGSNGVVIINSVYRDNAGSPNNKVQWRYTSSGSSGSLNRSSLIGNVNGAATLPNGLVLNDKDNVIIAEVYYVYTPALAADLIPLSDLYKIAVYKPRLGTLVTPPT